MSPYAFDAPMSDSVDYVDAMLRPVVQGKQPKPRVTHTKAKMSISFAPTITVIKSKREITNVTDTWYNEDEYESMLKDCIATITWVNDVSKVDRKEQEKSHKISTRGLHEMTPSGQLRKRKNIMLARIAVFEEQARQRFEGLNDPLLLSDIYFDNSFHCLEKAFTRAIRDCVDVYPEHR